MKNQLNKHAKFIIIGERVDQLLAKIEIKKVEHYDFLKKTVEVEDKLDELISFTDVTLNYTQNLLNQKKINTFKLTDPLIWNTQFEDGKYPNLRSRVYRAWYENKKLIINQFSLVSDQIIYYLIYSLMLVSFVYFLRKYYISTEFPTGENVVINRILIDNNIPLSAALVIALLLVMFPSAPILLSNFLASILLILSTWILNKLISKNDVGLIFNSFIILTLYNLEILAWYFGGYSRLYFLLEIGVAIFLYSTFYLNFLKNSNPDSEISTFAKKYLPYIIYSYIISALAQIVGFLNLSILLNKILAIIPMITIIVFMAYKVLNVFVLSISELAKVKLPLFNDVFPKHLSRMSVFNRILLIVIWVKLLGNAFQLDRTINQFISDLLDYTFTINSLSISLGDIIAFVVIIFATYYLIGLTSKFFNNDRVKSSRKTPRGFFAATSLSLRIIFVLFGGTIAMAKIGLDLGKFTIMAGALGVGIGFGLQDIVNNFISGLILIYGRPIQVGDTVEVDSLLGRVKSIGIRNSVLVTYDGAEVLVPNSILISNKLTNWTLSDNRKRVEVLIGVEYGSDLEEVIELMEIAASRIDTILKEPKPKALFLDFGDSSLNFRLRFWVYYEDGLSSKSDVSVEIYKMLADKGIAIPFPQLDVHHFNTEEKND